MKVNLDLLPVKLFYFCFFGGIASFGPFIPHYLYQLGFGPVDVTTVLGVVPLVAILIRPSVAHYADKSAKHRIILSLCILCSLFANCLLLALPSVEKHKGVEVISCEPFCAQGGLLANITVFDPSVMKCRLVPGAGSAGVDVTVIDDVCFTPARNDSRCEVVCQAKSGHGAHIHTGSFWLLFLFVLAGYSLGVPCSITLIDTMTLFILKDKPELFGRQKMFMTFGFALGILVTALVTDSVSSDKSVNYIPSFAFLSLFFCAALGCGLFVKFQGSTAEKHEKVGMRVVLPLLLKPRPILFLCVAFTRGVTQGLSRWLGVVWLKTLGGSQTVVGLCAVNVAACSAVSMAISPFLIRKLGHEWMALLTIASNCFRLILYSILQNPWYAMLIDILLGISTGLWMASVVGYAERLAPKNAKTSSQAIFVAMDEGLGMGCGNFVSGWIVRLAGPRRAWLSFGVFGLTIAGGYLVALALVLPKLDLYFKARDEPEQKPEKLVTLIQPPEKDQATDVEL